MYYSIKCRCIFFVLFCLSHGGLTGVATRRVKATAVDTFVATPISARENVSIRNSATASESINSIFLGEGVKKYTTNNTNSGT